MPVLQIKSQDVVLHSHNNGCPNFLQLQVWGDNAKIQPLAEQELNDLCWLPQGGDSLFSSHASTGSATYGVKEEAL